MFERTEATRYGERNQELLQTYYDSILLWSKLLEKHYQAVPGRTDWGYYGDGGNTENSVRPICYAAMTNAFLAEVEPPAQGASQALRQRLRREAISSKNCS